MTIATIPGAKLFHEGQFEGRKVRLPVFLGRRPVEPVDPDLQAFYHTLLKAASSEGLRNGNWQLCERTGWPDNASYQNLVAWCWRSAGEHHLIVVNLSDSGAQGQVRLPWDELTGKSWQMTDLFTGQMYERSGDEMCNPGLYVDLPPWQYHVIYHDEALMTMKKTIDHLDKSADFSLVLGGPLFQLLRRAHLTGGALELLRRRILVISLLAWLPLLVLSALEGQALGGKVPVPFLLDLEVHNKFLVIVPLLIVSELVVHQRMRFVVKQFLERNLIPESALPRFDAAIASAFRLRNSVLAEVLLIAFVYVVGVLIVWRHYTALATATWYAVPTGEGLKLSLSGMWYGYVSLPIFQFLMMRWYFRIFIWTRFLWQVSRIELSLIPTHPDRVGGLGFLSNTVYAFAPLAVAHGGLLAGFIANRIFYLGAALPQFKIEIAVVVVFLLCLVFGPLLLFAPQLAEAKRTGNREYGTLAERYVREFDAKWLRGGAPADEPLVGSGDIQSLADLSNSFEVVRTMRIAPVTKEAILRLVAATLAPVVPLALTMMPLEELLKRLIGIVF